MTENKNYRELQITEELPPSPSGEGLGMRYLPKSVISRPYPIKMGHNDLMTGIYNAVGVADIVAGGETKWNPRIEFEHVFQRRGKH
jgi:hypothetical protein